MTYEVLHYLATHGLTTPAGFIHLPALPEQAARRDPQIPSMGLETMVKGVRAALAVLYANVTANSVRQAA